MRKLFALVLSASVSLNSISQIKTGGSYKDYFLEGSYLFLEDNYPMAQDNFEAAYELDSTNANIHYLLGVCYLHSANQKSSAERHLEFATKKVNPSYKTDDFTEKTAPPLALFYYGQALHINYKFDEAKKQYDNFAKYVGPKDKDWQKKFEHEKAICDYAKAWYASPINIQITNLGDSVNSVYPDYSPVLSADERMLIYTTRRPGTTGGLKDMSGYYNEDVVVSYKDDNGIWSSPKPISNNINSSGMEASINISADGQTLIIYKDGGDGMGGNIYYSTFDGKDWSVLKEFGSDVNTKYWESHACLSQNGQALFFVSDRPGGFGGRDIYRCLKLPNNQWSKAFNMGASINTEFDEDGAFLHPDGTTFFFASKGHKSMGGFDIMFATLNEDNKFTDVTNMGYPINTTDDDVFYVTSPDGKRGYFSSAKVGGVGEKDIYVLSLADAKEKPLALFKGQIIAAEGEILPDEITILVIEKESGEVVGSYKPKQNGTFATILPPGKEYNFSYQDAQGEEFYNEDVFVTNDLSYQEIKREINLEPVKLLGKIRAKLKAIMLNAVVLDNNKSKKAISSAKITLTDEMGAPLSYNTDAKGKYDGIQLQPNKKYKLVAEANGKKSTVSEINTTGIKSGKVINQLIYLDGKTEKTVSKDLLLDVIVKNTKTKKIIPNASVTLTDADGNKTDLTTNESGTVKGIELSAGTKYTLLATVDGVVSEPTSFNTTGQKGGKAITKTLLVGQAKIVSNGVPSTENLPPSQYEFYFQYNIHQNDDDAIWTAFVDNVVALSNKKTVYINIKASASRVPTRAFKNNAELASIRAKKLQEKISAAVEAKGGNVKKLRYTKSSTVGGPKYAGDRDLGKDKYEKHQFVKAVAK